MMSSIKFPSNLCLLYFAYVVQHFHKAKSLMQCNILASQCFHWNVICGWKLQRLKLVFHLDVHHLVIPKTHSQFYPIVSFFHSSAFKFIAAEANAVFVKIYWINIPRVDRLRGDTCPYVCPQTGLN